MSYGSPNQKFQLAGMNFDAHQGLGGAAAGGMASNEMVMYFSYERKCVSV